MERGRHVTFHDIYSAILLPVLVYAYRSVDSREIKKGKRKQDKLYAETSSN